MARPLTELIEALLAYSQVGRTGHKLETVDLNEVVQQVLDDLQVPIQECGAHIEVDFLPTVETGKIGIYQIFQNLITNAVKFRGEETPVVTIKSLLGNGHIEITVEDNGIGMGPKHCDKIFVPFERLHSTARYPGSGIGLSTCKRIVEHHGGKIWFKSIPGKGTLFHFTIPGVSKPSPQACG